MAGKMDFKAIEEKWQKRWEDERIFESDPDRRKKFYITVAYPYPSGSMHIGHVRTYTVPDIISRFKRMQGYNVLFPMAWHVTGTPIIGAVNRLKEREKKQLHILKDVFKVKESELKGMTTPMSFAGYFIENHYKAGMKRLGYSIDWRRQFTTNDPHYNRFIEWQHGILYRKKLEKKGLHPVKWCLNCRNPVTTHDILEGEDADIEEFTILKFPLKTGKHKGKKLIAATMRPETIFGQTNMWVRPDIDYATARIGKEEWIMSRECAEKLSRQKKSVKITGKLKGEQLIGEYLKAPGVREPIIILPGEFVDPAVGTGIVTSVPSDAPYDYVALRDIQNDSKALKRYNLPKKVKEIRVIPIIDIPGYGDMGGARIVEEMGIKSQKETERLEEAKKKIYKLGFHTGRMNRNCGKYSGMPVIRAKDLVKRELERKGYADSILEFSEKVTCRCGHPVVVAKTETWFIDYANRAWKAKARKCVKKMKNIPTSTKDEFYSTIEWLKDWPCVRNFGLGTKLPQDKRFVIEPLSDSTIYMSFYPVAHRIRQYKPEQLTGGFFDYVILGKGTLSRVSKETGIPSNELKEMQAETGYWYPLDWRCSALELIPNHLTFMIFHHTAIFPESRWPKGIASWGMALLEGGKMSSSKGNVVLASDAINEYGADATRLFLFSSVEPWQDFDWRRKEVEQYRERLIRFHGRVIQLSRKGKEREEKLIDKWMLSELNRIVRDTTKSLEGFQTRKASLECFFRMSDAIRWYERRASEMNKTVLREVLEKWVKMLSPFIPHIAEELWEKLGNKDFCSTSAWPKAESKRIDGRLDMMEEIVRRTHEDIGEIMKLVKKKPEEIRIYVSPRWKYALYEKALLLTRKPQDIIPALMKSDLAKRMGKDALRFAQAIQKNVGDLKKPLTPEEEVKILKDSVQFLKKEYGCDVRVFAPGESDSEKARRAEPGKPGIEVT